MRMVTQRVLPLLLAPLLLLQLALAPQAQVRQGVPPTPSGNSPAASTTVYLPLLAVPTSSQQLPVTRRVNAPFIPGGTQNAFYAMTIFWFGKVSPTENYADVRVGYSATELVVRAAIFDRRLWYDPSPSANTFANYDGISLLLNLDGNYGNSPGPNAFRFNAGLSNGSQTNAQWAFRGNGSTWVETDSISYRAGGGWRGDALNNNNNDRGWDMTFRIPYTSLGYSGTPPPGTVWGLGVQLYDQDNSTGSPNPVEYWPESLNANRPTTWGQLHFGLPVYQPPSVSPSGSTAIRENHTGTSVPDAAVGGTVNNLCPGDENFIWNTWGNLNFGSAPDLNIQNQGDVADWPCYAKYYVTFPLSQIPPGKAILSASLILHQWGNNGPSNLAKSSLIHVLSVAEDWDETALTWNSAPLAYENLAQLVVPPIDCTNGGGQMHWPCTPREWDVSGAVASAYAHGTPLRLVVYSSDSDYHSGKLFSTSETGDWNEAGRPTLFVNWGNP